MSPNANLILASGSVYRAQLLRAAGVEFSIHPATLDERAIEAPLLEGDVEAADIAAILAQAKAMNVSESFNKAYVIGSDQTLIFEERLLHKPNNIEEARRRLLTLSGRSHQLTSAIAIAQNGEIIWHYAQTATIRFRKLTPEFIGHYTAEVGELALSSVGAYQIEGLGINLIESIEGDFFSIMGLPLLALLKKLRELSQIDG